jgi:malate dehydrogenase
VYLRGEYGVHDVYMGVPAVIGGQGVEKVVVIELDATERQMLESSVQGVRELVAAAADL